MASVYVYTIDTQNGNPYVRDYIQGRLIKKLTAGRNYCVSFYVNLEEISGYAIKEIGAYFDNGAIDATNSCGLPQIQCNPQVSNKGGIITDTAGWTKIEGDFIATGNEQFITIGNFKDKAHTTTDSLPINRYNATSPTSYYLIDDVSVVETGTRADAGPDTHVGQGDSVYIGRLMSEAIWCDWRVLGSSTIIGRGPGIWVKPTKATYYECTQTLCGAVTKDTVKVDVWKLGVTSINGQTQSYSLAPNPATGNVELSQRVEDGLPVQIKVYNSLGTLVYKANKTFISNVAQLNAEKLAPGMYHISLQDSKGVTYTLRFVKQ